MASKRYKSSCIVYLAGIKQSGKSFLAERLFNFNRGNIGGNILLQEGDIKVLINTTLINKSCSGRLEKLYLHEIPELDYSKEHRDI